MSAITIRVKKLNEKAVIPRNMSIDAACFDLVATEIIQEDENLVTVKYGFATQIPVGYKVCIAPRSNLTHKGWIMGNSPAQIDADYRGEWMSKFESIPVNINQKMSGMTLLYPDFPYKIGDRVCQCWVEKIVDTEFEEVEELTSTIRGSGSFGSTGK
jgi:dUTP pyrophosphatase